jgi:hypothetical protein
LGDTRHKKGDIDIKNERRRHKNGGCGGIKNGRQEPPGKRENCESIVTFTDILEKNTSE